MLNLIGNFLDLKHKRRGMGAGFAGLCGAVIAHGGSMIADKLSRRYEQSNAITVSNAAVSLAAVVSVGVLIGWCTADKIGKQFRENIRGRVDSACTCVKEYTACAHGLGSNDGMNSVERKTKEWYDSARETFIKEDDTSNTTSTQPEGDF